MGRALMYGGALIVAALVQTAWLVRMPIAGEVMDPVLVLAVATGILRGAESGAVVGLAGGLLQDLLSGGPLGMHGLSKLVVGFGSGLFERSIYIENPFLPAVAAFAGTLLGEALLNIVGVVTGLGTVSLRDAVPRVLIQAVLNSVIAPPLFRGIRALDLRFERQH
ncbi:MAG: rod shape-determining protein MreD [Armatimonadetes bacterium]|nr:rod shape-determining protein MreD [Armatimonadota bacterium]